MNRFLWLMVVTGLALAFGSSVALGGGPGKEHGKGPCPGKMAEFNLSADQEKQVMELTLAMKKKVAPAKAELEVKRAELKALWLADKPDRKTILAKQAEMDASRGKIREAKLDFHLGLIKILSAEQQKKMRGGWGKGHSGCSCGGHEEYGHEEGHSKGH